MADLPSSFQTTKLMMSKSGVEREEEIRKKVR